ncbi:MAG: biopolymer transporter ExbD [Woeseiaceae bacterium]
MSRRHGRRARTPVNVELDITAFMNLMVILVPFLLITAVFTHLTVLDINLPTSSEANSSTPNKKTFEINVIMGSKYFVVSDNRNRVIKKIQTYSTGGHFKILNNVLKQVKLQYPEKLNITILSQQNSSYESLIQTMDSVRVFNAVEDGQLVQVELFPNISIGDAPKLK